MTRPIIIDAAHFCGRYRARPSWETIREIALTVSAGVLWIAIINALWIVL